MDDQEDGGERLEGVRVAVHDDYLHDAADHLVCIDAGVEVPDEPAVAPHAYGDQVAREDLHVHVHEYRDGGHQHHAQEALGHEGEQQHDRVVYPREDAHLQFLGLVPVQELDERQQKDAREDAH